MRERERLRVLVERLPVATLLCDVQGRIEMANRSAGELLGCESELLSGQRVRRFLPRLETLDDERLRERAMAMVPPSSSASAMMAARGWWP